MPVVCTGRRNFTSWDTASAVSWRASSVMRPKLSECWCFPPIRATLATMREKESGECSQCGTFSCLSFRVQWVIFPVGALACLKIFPMPSLWNGGDDGAFAVCAVMAT